MYAGRVCHGKYLVRPTTRGNSKSHIYIVIATNALSIGHAVHVNKLEMHTGASTEPSGSNKLSRLKGPTRRSKIDLVWGCVNVATVQVTSL